MAYPDASDWQRMIQYCFDTIPKVSRSKRQEEERLRAGFIFSGKAQEITPRLLLLDKRLTPLERNAWQVLRMITANGYATPRYEDLQPYMASVPCGGKASKETVSRMLTMLRLTRWLTLVPRPRDKKDGRFRGSIYVLHDDPLTHRESIELDPDYLELLGKSLSHPTKAVRIVAEHVVNELLEDETIQLPELPSRIAIWANRLIHSEGLHEIELGQNSSVRIFSDPSSESEPSRKAPSHHAVRNPNADSTVLGIKESTVLRESAREDELDWPPALKLSSTERHACNLAISKLPAEMRQPVLSEAGARCATGSVRRPAAYLLGMIQKALTGDFRTWASAVGSAPPPPDQNQKPAQQAPPREPKGKPQPASPLAQSYLAELRSLARREPPK